MNRTNAVIAVVLVLLVGCWVFALVYGIQNGLSVFTHRSNFGPGPVKVTVPTKVPDNSVEVFNFRYSGDADSRFYAIGFSRALSDRLYCAPTCLTQQYTVNELSDLCWSKKIDFKEPMPDDKARKLGKVFGVRYAITGDMRLSSGNVDMTVNLLDLSKAALASIKVSGSISDLPSLQTKAVDKLVKVMKLNPSAAQNRELGKPNFTDPGILALYGRSSLSKNYKQVASYRWNMVDKDPDSSFAVLRLLEFYAYGNATCREIEHNTRLKMLLAGLDKRFPANSHIALLCGQILGRQYRYQDAEVALEQVADEDPDMARAHGALSCIARCRENGDLALEEGKKYVDLWPTNSIGHTGLSYDYAALADNERHGHYYNEMNQFTERKWRFNTQEGYREALIATKLNRDNYSAWYRILCASRELSRDDDVKEAYKEMVRINPKCWDAYIEYGFCFSPQWGGSDYEQQQVMADAEKAMGKGSTDALIVHARMIMCNVPSNGQRVGSPYASEVLSIANKVCSKSKDPDENMMLLKCRAYMLNRRRAEFLDTAQKSFDKWGSLEWRYLLGKGYAFKYEDKRDYNYLRKSEEMFSGYVKEIPYDPRGYIDWGWCLSHMGNRDEARAKFQKALDLDPANELAKEKMKYVQ